ncbi:MAG: hypothetical protein WCQ99_13400 [Pseudomonadota bacterium]
MLNQKFIHAIKTAGIPAYQIALKANVPPWALYKIKCGIDRPKPGDIRVLAVAAVLGLSPEDCFENEVSND